MKSMKYLLLLAATTLGLQAAHLPVLATPVKVEFKDDRFEAALELIQRRNANKVCANDAYQSTIIELAARAVAVNPEGLSAFVTRIPENSDILKNLLFRALINNIDLQNLNDVEVLKKLLVETRYFSRVGVGFGSKYVVDLKAGGNALIMNQFFSVSGRKGRVEQIVSQAKWEAALQLDPQTGLQYPVVRVFTPNHTLEYHVRTSSEIDFIHLVAPAAEELDYQIFFLDPSEC